MAQVRRSILRFPDPVNEIAARCVAGGVVVLGVLTIATGQRWLIVPLVYGFGARVLSGPTLSPLGLFVTRVLVPRLPFAERPVPGPPKRFAQGMGLAFSTTALVLAFGFGLTTAAWIVVGMLAAAAFLESAFGLCLGCVIFGRLAQAGLVPVASCAECADLSLRRPQRVGSI